MTSHNQRIVLPDKRQMKSSKSRNVYLDDASVQRAETLGGGNVSEGIRKALALAASQQEQSLMEAGK